MKHLYINLYSSNIHLDQDGAGWRRFHFFIIRKKKQNQPVNNGGPTCMVVVRPDVEVPGPQNEETKLLCQQSRFGIQKYLREICQGNWWGSASWPPTAMKVMRVQSLGCMTVIRTGCPKKNVLIEQNNNQN